MALVFASAHLQASVPLRNCTQREWGPRVPEAGVDSCREARGRPCIAGHARQHLWILPTVGGQVGHAEPDPLVDDVHRPRCVGDAAGERRVDAECTSELVDRESVLHRERNRRDKF
jgi:hypothetical protein